MKKKLILKCEQGHTTKMTLDDSMNEQYAIHLAAIMQDMLDERGCEWQERGMGAACTSPVDVKWDWDMSSNQRLFVEDAKAAGLEVDYEYVGKNMKGKHSPAVFVISPAQFATKAEHLFEADGQGWAIYAPI